MENENIKCCRNCNRYNYGVKENGEKVLVCNISGNGILNDTEWCIYYQPKEKK